LPNRITYQLQFFNSLHSNDHIPLEKRSIKEQSEHGDILRMTYEKTIRVTQ